MNERILRVINYRRQYNGLCSIYDSQEFNDIG